MNYLLAFVLLWLWRYTRTVVNIISSWTFKPIPLPTTPSYTPPKDVTVVISTLGTNEEFRRSLLSVVACQPNDIIVVTPRERVKHISSLLESLNISSKVRILGARRANKRLQMVQGLKDVRTAITVFADDDVFLPTTFLTYLLAPFEDPKVGAAGTSTKPERPSNPNLWEFLGACYLERWNFDIAATSHIDGGIACLSGRTAAVRTSIVQDQKFIDEFKGEKWFGIDLLAADDDNFITRYLVNHRWKIAIQSASEAALTTALESNSKFGGQCIRWFRTTWRSNFTSLFVDRVIWKEQRWSTYALHLSSFNPPAIVIDSFLAYLLYQSLETGQLDTLGLSTSTGLVYFGLWLLFTKTVKLWPYFCEHPEDLSMLPIQILFGYLHGGIKLYSLVTLHRTSWSGGKASIVAKYAKGTGAAFMSSGYKALESTGLKRVGSSGTDLYRLGEVDV